MNEITERVLELLAEVDRACANLKIKYICGGLMPKAVVEETEEDFDSLQVFVRARDLIRLMDQLKREGGKNRGVESFATNPAFPTMSFHYADLSTTVYSGNKPVLWEHCCAYIDVIPLFEDGELPQEQLILKEALRVNHRKYSERFFREHTGEFAESVRQTHQKLLKKGRFGRKRALKSICAQTVSGQEVKRYVAYVEFDGAVRKWKVPVALYSKTKRYTVAGTEVPMPSNMEKWYGICYPMKGEERKYPVYRNQYTVASAQVPFEKMKAYLDADPVSEAELLRVRDQMSEEQKRINSRQPAIDAVWEYAMELYGVEQKAQ